MAGESKVEDNPIQEIARFPVDFDFFRSDVLGWIEVSKEADGRASPVPPAFIILHADLLEEGWGWTRLVPYNPCFVEWPEYKKYLEEYFNRNSGADLGVEKKCDLLGCIAAEKDALNDAANLCLKKERMLLKKCVGFLTPDDVGLIRQIKQHAKQMIQSEVDQPLTATVCLECIASEAELMLDYLPCDFDINQEVAICRKIRLSAFNLMHYKGSASAAVAGAMVGIAREAKSIIHWLNQEDTDVSLEFLTCEKIRVCTASALTQLEKDFAYETAAANNAARPMGAPDVRDLNSDVSGSMEGCADMDTDCGNNQVEVNHENETRVAALMITKN